MESQRTKKKTPTHSQKVKEEKERELDLDFDGDGLTEREERKYGLNPLSPDSDGDGLYDGQEIENGTNPHSPSKEPPPVERGSDKEGFRNAYLSRARSILNNRELTYRALYEQLSGEDWLGSSLDERVMAAELDSGSSPEEAESLIAQSPYLQWQLSEGDWDLRDAIGYVEGLTAGLRLRRGLEGELPG
jgi:hypothetical protein